MDETVGDLGKALLAAGLFALAAGIPLFYWLLF